MTITFTKQSGIYTLTSQQKLPISLEEAWDFFSKPSNLDKITPPEMAFTITNNPPLETYAGQIITYKIGALPFIKSNWITEITHLEEQKFFVDEQRFGPYAMWHHEHHFKSLKTGGVLMTDIVNYKMPFGILGDLLAGTFVKNKVKFIFAQRFKILEKLW